MLSSIRNELSRVPAFQRAVQPADSSASSRTALAALSPTGNLLAGAVARTSVGFVLNPITILKARFESNAYSEYRTLTGAMAHLWRTEGVRGLFQGFTATAVRDAPYAGIYVVFYEWCKEIVGESTELLRVTPGANGRPNYGTPARPGHPERGAALRLGRYGRHARDDHHVAG